MNFFWPDGLSMSKLHKIGSLRPLTILPLIQTHFTWILPFPAILLGFLLLYDPRINWTNPSKLPETPECDWVKLNIE